MQVQTIEIHPDKASGGGGPLTAPLLKPDNRTGSRLMVLLPGRGYTIDAPLMFYSRILGWHHGYDTLLVSYRFQVEKQDLTVDHLPHIHTETQQLVEAALAAGDYTEVVIVGKSMGTPIAATLATTLPHVRKLILLTPVRNSHTIANTVPTLAIIGTNDAAYHDDLIDEHAHLRWRVFDDLDHSMLKAGDLTASTQALVHIMQACEEFLLH